MKKFFQYFNMIESDMKKILVVGMTENPGGIEAMIMGLLSHIDCNRYQLDFIANTTTLAFEDSLRAYGCKVYHITSRHDNRITFYHDLEQIFSQHASEYDAIWQNSNSLANIDYLIYAKKFGIPIRIIHCHNSSNSEGLIRGILHKMNQMRITSYATHYWSVSDEASQWYYGNDYKMLPNYRVISNAVDIHKFAFSEHLRETMRGKLNLPPNAVVALNVGRLHPQKNQELIVSTAAQLVNKKNEDIHIVLVGEGDRRESVAKAARQYGISERVHFVGAVDDATAYYSAADIFFFPSLYEGISFSFLEAQANGIPCLISDGIAKECIVNSNVVVEQRASNEEQWARSFEQALGMGRLSKSELLGTRFDREQQRNLFNQLWSTSDEEE